MQGKGDREIILSTKKALLPATLFTVLSLRYFSNELTIAR